MSPLTTIRTKGERFHHLTLILRALTVLLLLLIYLEGHGWAQGVSQAGVVVQDTSGNQVGTNGSGNSLNVQCTSGCSGSGGGGAVSFATTTLLNAVAATGSQTSAAVAVATLSGYGTVYITGAGITGSPSGCSVVLNYQTNIGNQLAGATINFTPATSVQAFAINAGTANSVASADKVVAAYSCSTTYPSAGTLSVVFTPINTVQLTGALPTGANTIGAVTQASGPWTSNVTQINSAAVATAASGVQKVGIVGNAGTSLETTAGVVDHNVKNIGNSAVSTAAAGTQLVGAADGSGNKITSNSTTTTSTQGLDVNIRSVLNTAPTVAGRIDVTCTAANCPINIANIGGSAAASVGSGIMPVGGAPGNTAAGALTLFQNSAVTTAVVVKASAGNLFGFVVPADSGCFVQFMNTASSPVLGTNAIFSVPITAQQTWVPGMYALNNFTTGISVGLSTTYNGATACATSGPVVVFYK